mmetsp:Transcript_3193/g.4893  ORF Transcript_3193/g.4893 Transcript_3193/m.4893 type:complete len:126 (+) Transcript_3193:866-1243(+)
MGIIRSTSWRRLPANTPSTGASTGIPNCRRSAIPDSRRLAGSTTLHHTRLAQGPPFVHSRMPYQRGRYTRLHPALLFEWKQQKEMIDQAFKACGSLLSAAVGPYGRCNVMDEGRALGLKGTSDSA